MFKFTSVAYKSKEMVNRESNFKNETSKSFFEIRFNLMHNIFFRMQLEFYRSARFYLSIKVGVRQAVKDKTDETSFCMCATDLLESTNIEEELHNQINAIAVKIDNYTRNG
jgi:hypothetical protein